ncbi:prenyltransferase/squalene oxidase repeat-containing protein [Neorhodopirellula pilleata]|uniref:Glycosyl Hydrolase Family 88 n=1 Tax=Neorhodopirellula pilleata TaxID=2714738 RepID=A0A5C6AV64_9BACT|nr:prenyltransferase/squalene oxidase repeat-containing protein [Neorhodopirellula pilleata]TWU03377.1 Glycosyl Hydrolase Family 88 [Neorhodopirellula pilleata]
MSHSDPPASSSSDDFSSGMPAATPNPPLPNSPPPLPPVLKKTAPRSAPQVPPTPASRSLPPPPAPRATLPPVGKQVKAAPITPLHHPDPVEPTVPSGAVVRGADARSATSSTAASAGAHTAGVAVANASTTNGTKVSRWRVPESTHSARPPAEDVGEKLEPVRKSVPAWLVSLILHITLLLALALWTTPIGQGISRVVLEFGEAIEQESVELQEFSLESADSAFNQDDSDAEVPMELDVQEMIDAVELAEPVEMVPLDIGSAATDITVQPMFSGRSGAMKSALLAMYGGNQETMDAVERGLRWLARNQEKSGSWSMKGPFDDGSYSENRIAATAMAMLAFQGDGNTHLAGPYQSVVEKGLRYLISKQSRRDGFFARDAPGHEKAYAQAQATIAICELYAMTKDSSLRGPAQAAVDYALKAQSSEGGWRYEPRQDSDLSVTGWYVMALTSAKSAGLDVNQSSMSVINGYLDTVSTYEGAGYSYQRGRPATPAMTAEGLLCRQYLGWDRDREAMVIGVDTLVQDWPIDFSDMNVYYWYYATQSIHHFGGKPWEQWNGKMRVELPQHQVKRGGESGSWSPQADQWGENSGRLFTTCLSIYCLEVYYRHLPLYKAGGN